MSTSENIAGNQGAVKRLQVPTSLQQKKIITYGLYEDDVDRVESDDSGELDKKPYKMVLVWRNIVAMVLIHGMGLYGLAMLPYSNTVSIVFGYFVAIIGAVGVQAGAHRLWSHRTYKANFGVRLFLSLCHVVALQNDIYEWCRDHRAHHKFSDTDGDPHNSTRGFFFSHVGWLMCKKHPDVKRRGCTIDLSDLEADPVVTFQRRFYIPLVLIFWGFLPAYIPMYFWNESLLCAVTGCVFARYAISLNITWLVNSWSHLYGYRPYNTKISPVEASCRHLLMGEGFHNYHHAFPWDYSASELGTADVFNAGTAYIDFFHYMGWAWDLKKVNKSLVDAKKQSSGDPAFYHKKNTAILEWVLGMFGMLIPMLVMLAIQQVGRLLFL